MQSLSSLLLVALAASHAAVAIAAPNCLSDVIVARGLERRGLERRSSWSYEGASGVQHWGQFSTTCDVGEHQSPVDFETDELAIQSKPDLKWSQVVNPFTFINNGHTVQMQLNQSSLFSTQADNRQYAVQQLHFHSPSEHRVHSKYFDLEAHFVHASADGKLNVIGVLFEVSEKPNPWIDLFIDNLPANVNVSTYLSGLDMSVIINHLKDTDYYSYSGSLTTPPCTEGILWMVARKALPISVKQLLKFREVMPFNSRPAQANADLGEHDDHHASPSASAADSKPGYAPAAAATQKWDDKGLYSSSGFKAGFATLFSVAFMATLI
ncbi:hypothetical protein HDU77_009283 [Chytriomyces hyalinus]|nr:hypothetical protein HDU77_009283 [Chytriomyces hyalinus]